MSKEKKQKLFTKFINFIKDCKDDFDKDIKAVEFLKTLNNSAERRFIINYIEYRL